MDIQVRRLGLAAYIKMQGGVLLGHECDEDGRKGWFRFSTNKTAEAWEIEYSNSCCSTHDAEVMNLRKLMG